MSQVHVDTTIRETVPDGGVDACVRHIAYVPAWSGSRWFPEGNSAWQFKSGRCPSAPNLSSQEFTKPEVIAAIDRDYTYCFLTADSLTSRKKTNIAKAIRAQYTARGKIPLEPRIYSGDDLARWTLEHLGIALRHFLVPVACWQPFEQWANASRFRNEYFPDAARHQLFTDVRAWIAQQRHLIRIVGAAGVGKTRAAMEALRPDGLSQRVLYLEDAARLDPNFSGICNTRILRVAAYSLWMNALQPSSNASGIWRTRYPQVSQSLQLGRSNTVAKAMHYS